MSVNYAAELSPYPNKGVCGLPELSESMEAFHNKVSTLADWVRQAKHLVVHTGAGVSTAAGVPDFRGPSGVWTLEQRGEEPQCNISFEDAAPTYTHMALCALEAAGYVKFVVTQNVDGLHARSGFPLDRLAELHGNVFAEACQTCHARQIRPHVIKSVGQKFTGGTCGMPRPTGRPCRGRLRDTTLDWEDELPASQLVAAERHSRLADFSLCLGTSLRIQPANTLPLYAKKNGGRLAIVNLQKTKLHAKADLVLHARVDDVMRELCRTLSVDVPAYAGPVIRQTSLHVVADVNGTDADAGCDQPRLKRRRVERDSVDGTSVASLSLHPARDVEIDRRVEQPDVIVKPEVDSDSVHSVLEQICTDVVMAAESQ